MKYTDEQPSLDSSIQSPKGLKKQHKFLDPASSAQKQKLIEQNIHLKTQIFELSQQLENVMGKEEKSRKGGGGKNTGESEAMRVKKMELKREQLEVHNLKTKINVVKKQLEAIYSNRTLLAKEEKLKSLKSELQSLQQQKQNLIKLKDSQNKILKIIRTEQEYELRLEQLKKQLALLKQESKSLTEKQMQTERTLRKNHEAYIVKEKKLKEIEARLGAGKGGKGSRVDGGNETVSKRMLQELREEVQGLEEERKNNERTWLDKINAVETSMREKKQQEEKRLALLKEKERELRLMQYKIKQATRAPKRNATEASVTSAPEPDMHQFRYRRNIKYMREQ